ncbi:MAG: tRNA pseudouridine(38-40) synthase TruA [Acidobacteria bacterium]|nr:tRNA pseudouridine(38-40) synthase TruA [Acidobacteriota bacterium]
MSDEHALAIVLAYDGRGYHGWQLQPGRPTVQGTLQRALDRLHGLEAGSVSVVGAGRTDAGVHALGQVASYFPPTARAPETLQAGLAGLLPEDLRALAVREMPREFHACRSASGKVYRYRIINRELALPFESPWAWHVRAPLDTAAMRAAAAALVGRHDFAAFASAGGQSATTVRELRRLALREDDGTVSVEAEGDGFLHRMVRNITGFLVDVGRGRRRADEAAAVLASCDRRRAGGTAPARGLCLVRVIYPPEYGL